MVSQGLFEGLLAWPGGGSPSPRTRVDSHAQAPHPPHPAAPLRVVAGLSGGMSPPPRCPPLPPVSDGAGRCPAWGLHPPSGQGGQRRGVADPQPCPGGAQGGPPPPPPPPSPVPTRVGCGWERCAGRSVPLSSSPNPRGGGKSVGARPQLPPPPPLPAAALDGQRSPPPCPRPPSEGMGPAGARFHPPKKGIKGCGGLECPCTARWGARGLTFHRLPRLAFSGAVKGKKRGGGKGERKKINFKRLRV